MKNAIAFDTETALIEPGLKAPPLTCISLAVGDATDLVKVPDTARTAAQLLTMPLLVGHNVAYDLAVIMAEHPELTPEVFRALDEDRVTDTMIRQLLIDISEGQLEGSSFNPYEKKFVRHEYSLAALARRHLGITLDKDTHRLGFGALRDVPIAHWPSGAAEYATEDALHTLRVFENQEKWRDVLDDQFRQTRGLMALHLTSCHGLVTDADAIEKFRVRVLALYEEAKATCLAASFIRTNGTRDTKVAKAAMARACQKLGISINRTKTYKELEKSGDTETLKTKLAKDQYFGVSLDEEACTRTADPQLIAYANVSSLMTVVNDHIPNLLNGTKAPIQPSFSVLVDTGRTACKGHKEGGSSYGFQVQNVRRLPGIRECFIPRPGYVYVDADYTGLELHTWAQVCYWLFGFSHMGGALNKGLDPHLIIAAHMLGQDYDTTLTNYKAGCPEEKEARQFGKIGNFGLMGGMGIATFISWSAASYGKILTVEQATKIKEAWLAAWPEAKEYFNHVSRLLREGGDEAHVVHFKSNRHRGPLRFTQTANTFFQGLGADAAKAALYEVVKSTFVGELVGCHVVNFVHDEILLEAPEDFAVGALETLSRIMVETAHKWLPDVKPKVDGVLMRRWSKEAKKVFDSNGNLIPWDW